MAQFKSYARPTGFNAIQVPDESQKYLQQGNNFIRSLQTAAQFDIAEKNRQLTALTKNNDLENANRDFIFQRDMENKQRVQQAILGNYDIAVGNAETQALNQARFYEQLSNFSNKAVEVGADIYQRVQKSQQERFDKSFLESGADPIKVRMEWAKLGNNTSDQTISENQYFQELIHNNGITTAQIRYLGENLNSSKFGKSRAVAESLGKSIDPFLLEQGDTKYDVGMGQPISLNEATQLGNLGAQRAVLSRLQTDFYRANNVGEFPTAVQQQYINPYIRAAENAFTQRASSTYRQAQADESKAAEFEARTNIINDSGPGGLAVRTTSLTGTARTLSLKGDKEYFSSLLKIPGKEMKTIAQIEQYYATPTVKNGREMTVGEAVADRPEFRELAVEVESARDAALQREVKKTQRPAIEAAILENEVLSKTPPQTREEVEALYEKLRSIPGNGGYTSNRLEAILRNETTEAKAYAAMDEDLRKLAELNLLTPDELNRRGAPLALRQKYGPIAEATAKDRGINGNYKVQLEGIENAVKSLPNVVKMNGTVDWTVGVKISQLQNQFYTRLAALRAAGDTNPGLPTQVMASVINEFQANPQISTTRNGVFGGFTDILRISGPSGTASARARHVFGGLEQASRDGQANTFLDRDGAVYTVSELKEIVADSKKPGWKPDSMAVDIGSRLGVSPLTVINRQLAARQDPSLPLLSLPQPLMQYQTGIRPEFQRLLDTTPTPDISRRAMISTGTFEPATIPKGYGPLVVEAATNANISPVAVAALAEAENGTWDPNIFSGGGYSWNGRSTGVGLMQLSQQFHGRGATAAEREQSLKDPRLNLTLGAGIMRNLYQKYGNWKETIYNWNMGETGYAQWVAAGRPQTEQAGYAQGLYERFEKARAKYGDVSALQSPGVMRGSMRGYGRGSFERPSSVVFETSSGQPGVDLYFESKRFPAVLGGTVKDVSREPGYGNYIVIESTDPMTGQKVDVLYAHLADGIAIRPGQQIDAGDIIGIQGGTGNVRSVDGTIASIDFLAPAPRGSKSMTPYAGFNNLRQFVVSQLQR